MELREYIFRKQISITEFSNQIGYARSYVGEVISGKTKPGKKMILAIEKATNGEVTKDDLLRGYNE